MAVANGGGSILTTPALLFSAVCSWVDSVIYGGGGALSSLSLSLSLFCLFLLACLVASLCSALMDRVLSFFPSFVANALMPFVFQLPCCVCVCVLLGVRVCVCGSSSKYLQLSCVVYPLC